MATVLFDVLCYTMVSALLLRGKQLVPHASILSVKKNFCPRSRSDFFLKLKIHKNMQKSISVQLKNLVSFFPKRFCFIYNCSQFRLEGTSGL